MPKTLQKDMTFHSDKCEKHNISKMLINEKVVCPRCELSKEERALQATIQRKFNEVEKKRKQNVLYRKSITPDETLLNATIENYTATESEQIKNKAKVIKCLERIESGQVFNIILHGVQGAGKSHLSYAILQELNSTGDNSCLFINVDEMLRLIRDSFNNRESKYTESYFTNLLSSVDYLVLDDIGAETGAIDTSKTASDFVHRVLYAVTTARQNKTTIVTTNLSSKALFKLYDKKVVSRLFNRPKYIMFKETKDKRMSSIPF